MISNLPRILLVLLGTIVLMASRAAAAVELVPHEAVYRLGLLEADTKALQDAGTRVAIIQSSGALGLRLKRHCGSWQSQSELLFTIELDNGKIVRVHNMLRLRENVGGQRVEFTGWTDSEKTGKVDTRGSATIPASGDPGEVKFDKPKKDQRKLAIGMGLPTESFTKIMEQLLIGETPAPVHYFDPYSKYTEMRLLGGAPTILKRPPEGDAELVEGKSWRLRVTPVYETEILNELGGHTIVQVHANGIASYMIIDLGNIKLDATLIKVRRIESSGCAPAPVAAEPKAGMSRAEMPQEGISIEEIPNLEALAEDPPKDTAPPDS
jgi:hypothetical protein